MNPSRVAASRESAAIVEIQSAALSRDAATPQFIASKREISFGGSLSLRERAGVRGQATLDRIDTAMPAKSRCSKAGLHEDLRPLRGAFLSARRSQSPLSRSGPLRRHGSLILRFASLLRASPLWPFRSLTWAEHGTESKVLAHVGRAEAVVAARRPAVARAAAPAAAPKHTAPA